MLLILVYVKGTLFTINYGKQYDAEYSLYFFLIFFMYLKGLVKEELMATRYTLYTVKSGKDGHTF